MLIMFITLHHFLPSSKQQLEEQLAQCPILMTMPREFINHISLYDDACRGENVPITSVQN